MLSKTSEAAPGMLESGARRVIQMMLAVAAMAAGLMTAVFPGGPEPVTGRAGGASAVDSSAPLRLLALGDINLGRRLGQKLLGGDTLHPWKFVADTLAAYDVVFANLESNLSDQGGRTEDPSSNTVFTGPPIAAASLKRGGITVVSTANNHSLDFGASALRETIALLDSAGIAHAGTSAGAPGPDVPALLTVRGYRLAFFACTELMNDSKGKNWKRWVADADTSRLLPAVRAARSRADIVVVSIHGGDEYAPRASARILAFARAAVDAGADVVLGHHPHVPYGIERRGRSVIAPSLGNFVFKQPFQYWTQRSFALAVEFRRDSSGSGVREVRCMPLHVDYQPFFLNAGEEYETVIKRVCNGSTSPSHE
jgi:poly-gamma-glutamate synthesis protein (capsule biosynthesis protein)